MVLVEVVLVDFQCVLCQRNSVEDRRYDIRLMKRETASVNCFSLRFFRGIFWSQNNFSEVFKRWGFFRFFVSKKNSLFLFLDLRIKKGNHFFFFVSVFFLIFFLFFLFPLLLTTPSHIPSPFFSQQHNHINTHYPIYNTHL